MTPFHTLSQSHDAPLMVDIKDMEAAAREAVQAIVGTPDTDERQRAGNVIRHVFLFSCKWMLLQLAAEVDQVPTDDHQAAGRAAMRRMVELMENLDRITAQQGQALQ